MKEASNALLRRREFGVRDLLQWVLIDVGSGVIENRLGIEDFRAKRPT